MSISRLSAIFVDRRSTVDTAFGQYLKQIDAVPSFAYVVDILPEETTHTQHAAYKTVFLSEALFNTKAGREIFRLANEVWTGTTDSHNRQDLPLRCIKGQGAEQPAATIFGEQVFDFFRFLFRELGLTEDQIAVVRRYHHFC